MTTRDHVTGLQRVGSLSAQDCRLLLDSVVDYAIVVLDPEGRITSWSAGAERIHGYSGHESLGRQFARTFPRDADDRELPARLLQAAARTGRAQHEGWRRRADGTLFWGSSVLTAMREDGGALRGFAEVTQDLTGRHTEELQLRESEARFHHMVDAITEYAIFMLDPVGHVVTWNAGAERAKGYRPAEIIGEHFSRFYTPEDRANGKPAHMLELAQKDGRAEDEGWRLRKDGTRFWANVVITALRDKAGVVYGYSKVTRDLTERRAVVEALRRSEERFRLLVESVVDYAIFVLDPEGRVATWNPGAQRMKGYVASEILGRHFACFFPREDVEAGKPERELATARAEGRFEDEGWRVRKDGGRFWANVIVTRLQDAQGQLLGFAKITRDLTERRELVEAERRVLREQAARAAAQEAARSSIEANRIKDEFLATVSHELRTPLNAIIGWTTLLRQRPLEPGVARGVDVIDRNAHVQAKLIEDILDVARIITGKLRLDPKPVDLVAITRAAIDVVRPSATAKQIDVSFEPPEPECILVADADRLQQVIWNLLSNAVKFTNAGGQVRVGLEQDGSTLSLHVKDTGQGIEAEFLPHVFERFRQADSSTTRRHGGLGLGLALVRHIVELHGGTVTCSSEGPGSGATFGFTLPIRAVVPIPIERAQVQASGDAAPMPRVDLTRLRVLVVDDDADARELLATLLARFGGVVETAGSVSEALETLRAFQPDVLVSDIGMAGEDGYTLMQRIRSLGEAGGGNVPAIALTAYTRNEDRAKALAAGFTTHLGKPVNPHDLIETIEAVASPLRAAR